VAAALGADLVFELNAVGTGTLQRAHGVVGVDGVAKAGVGIDQQRHFHGVADAGRMVGDIAETHETLVGHAEPHIGHASTGHIDGFKAQIGNQPRRHGVEGSGTMTPRRASARALSCCLGS
jgi:hypothetical protein